MSRIYLIGYTGDAAGILMYQKNREALENRFSRAFLSSLEAFAEEAEERADRMEKLPARELIREDISRGRQNSETVSGKYISPEGLLVPLGSGGLYQGLWTLSETLRFGFRVDMRRVPIHQEIIEVSEALGINPYEISSRGSWLLAGGEAEAEICSAAGLPLAEIGEVSREKGKILMRNGEEHFLNRPVKKPLY